MNFMFISSSISFENQFKSHFISVFLFHNSFYLIFLIWACDPSVPAPILCMVSLETFMSAVSSKFSTFNFVYNTWSTDANHT